MTELISTFIKIRPELKKYLLKVTRDSFFSDDLLGDLSLRLLQIKTQPENSNLKAYIYTTLKSIMIDNYRAKQRRPFNISSGAEINFNRIMVADTPYDEINIDSLLKLISGQQREVIKMRLDDRSFKELSAETGLGVQTLITQYRIGVVKIKRQLKIA